MERTILNTIRLLTCYSQCSAVLLPTASVQRKGLGYRFQGGGAIEASAVFRDLLSVVFF